jgi:hypothetical protein
MRKLFLTFIVILYLVIPLRYSFADKAKGDKETAEIVLQFMDESGRPLSDVEISIFKLAKEPSNPHVDFFVKEKPVDKEGRLRLSNAILPIPAGSQIGIHSKDDYYYHYVNFEDVSIQNGTARITVPKTGIIVATIQNYPSQIKHPVVVEVLKKGDSGSYETVRGIGIFLSKDYRFEVNGLPTGAYKLQIKDDYESKKAHFEQETINVVSGRRTDIGKINLK